MYECEPLSEAAGVTSFLALGATGELSPKEDREPPDSEIFFKFSAVWLGEFATIVGLEQFTNPRARGFLEAQMEQCAGNFRRQSRFLGRDHLVQGYRPQLPCVIPASTSAS